jgi:hypothetical protein
MTMQSKILQPTLAGIIALATFGLATNGAQTAERSKEPIIKLPTTELPARPAGSGTGGTYTFTLKSFKITDTRALHNDTDFVSIAVTVGKNPPIVVPTKSMGDVNNGTHEVNLSIPNVRVEPGQTVAFSYSIVNSGYKKDKIEQDLKKAVSAEAPKAVEAGATALGDLLGCDDCGTAVGKAASSWFTKKMVTFIFADCDGTVAAGDHTFPQAALAKLTAGGKLVTAMDDNKGTKSPIGCGGNSRYYVTWSVSASQTSPVAQQGGKAGGGGKAPNGPPHKLD